MANSIEKQEGDDDGSSTEDELVEKDSSLRLKVMESELKEVVTPVDTMVGKYFSSSLR